MGLGLRTVTYMDWATEQLIGRFDQVHVNSLVIYFYSLSFCEMKKCPVVGFLSLVPVIASVVGFLLPLRFCWVGQRTGAVGNLRYSKYTDHP